MARVREAAKREGITVSAFIEQAILDGLRNTESVDS
ncbi:MAG: ribbon-helix-helix protein, CopG family [Anaerolineales bacterium]|nr:ribbon-helix-helix protein, CopG family [Anaerolineales bacterium]